jgi:hypothetical protein
MKPELTPCQLAGATHRLDARNEFPNDRFWLRRADAQESALVLRTRANRLGVAGALQTYVAPGINAQGGQRQDVARNPAGRQVDKPVASSVHRVVTIIGSPSVMNWTSSHGLAFDCATWIETGDKPVGITYSFFFTGNSRSRFQFSS